MRGRVSLIRGKPCLAREGISLRRKKVFLMRVIDVPRRKVISFFKQPKGVNYEQ
jgi:hypothetical protein